MKLDDYRVVLLTDSGDYDEIYETILLSYEHTVDEFQTEIDRIKEEHKEEIQLNGDDWNIVKANISDKFDWQELNSNLTDRLSI